jgi:hypothetical protein
MIINDNCRKKKTVDDSPWFRHRSSQGLEAVRKESSEFWYHTGLLPLTIVVAHVRKSDHHSTELLAVHAAKQQARATRR